MKTYICQVCGDAYLGKDRPSDCPFCGAPGNFIKLGNEVNPIVAQKIEISKSSMQKLEETMKLEMKANAIYLCMADKADAYEVRAMYKRIAKVELEHANIACKLMGIALPKSQVESCNDEDVENFKATVALEEHATSLYANFAKEATEQNIKILFTALAQAEADHINLIKNYL